MKNEQFVKLQWVDSKPYFKFLSIDRNYNYLPVTHRVKIKKLSTKYCIGSYNLQELKEYPCELTSDLTGSKYSRCKHCETLTGYRSCLMCKGYSCNVDNLVSKDFCAKDHYVYIAYFPNSKLKVGTAIVERSIERLLEQGAIFSMFIARSNGRIARQIETEISRYGITSQVNSTFKIKHLMNYASAKEAIKLITEKIEYLKTKLNPIMLSYFIPPKFNNFEHLLVPLQEKINIQISYDLFGNIIQQGGDKLPYSIVESVFSIGGEILTAIGSIVVLMDKNTFFAFDTKKLAGWMCEFEQKI